MRGGALSAAEFAIDVRGLNKHFGPKHVVKDLTLQVRPGEIYGFLGPNGSGKTTSIRMLCGLLTPDSGEGTCLGYDVIRQTAAIKREVGYMTQRFSLWEDLTIRENLEFVARMYGMVDRRRAVAEAIDRLGLGDRRSATHGLAGHRTGPVAAGGVAARAVRGGPGHALWQHPARHRPRRPAALREHLPGEGDLAPPLGGDVPGPGGRVHQPDGPRA